jgi:hypothetical protein
VDKISIKRKLNKEELFSSFFIWRTEIEIVHLRVNKNKSYMKRFKKSELVLLALVIMLIGISEYYFVFLNDPLKAIFIGLWCPTILGFVMIFNLKGRNGKS